MNPGEHQIESFVLAWADAEKQGKADDLGGAEYRRAMAEWDQGGRKLDAPTFIAQKYGESVSEAQGKEKPKHKGGHGS